MEIIICSNCRGHGHYVRSVNEGHTSSWENVHCEDCNGTGKQTLFQLTVKVPFDPSSDRDMQDVKYNFRREIMIKWGTAKDKINWAK